MVFQPMSFMREHDADSLKNVFRYDNSRLSLILERRSNLSALEFRCHKRKLMISEDYATGP